jgi:phospholipase D1/2
MDNKTLATTHLIRDNLNPEWCETFYVPVAHFAESLTFCVQDADVAGTVTALGEYVLPIDSLVRYEEEAQARVGIHKIAPFTTQGSLEFFVEFIPEELQATENNYQQNVPGVYFRSHQGNQVKLYVNADDGDEVAPTVKYGAPDERRVWHPPRLWRDIYDAICDAKHFIYITGWSVDTTQSLLRGEELEEALNKGSYSPYIGELLKQKADEGVTVNMLVWDDATSNPNLLRPVGFMGTHDEQSKAFFEGSRVNFRLAPMQGDEDDSAWFQMSKYVMFTHHQKIVVLDAACEDDEQREPLAFVGGIDLTTGRWDNRKHPLFRTLGTDHKGDAYNGCFAVDVANVGPREPWHDIHSSLRGPAAYDVICNFTERWCKQASDAVGELVDLQSLGLGSPCRPKSRRQMWYSQVLRSIDERTAVFDKDRYMGENMDSDDFSPGTEWEETYEEGTRIFKTREPFSVATRLNARFGQLVDSSMQRGWIHHIRNAKHTLYIESQYFLGSAHMWPEQADTCCDNLIPAEITLKICDKIKRGERFAAYILVPLWPEGIPDSASVQAILHWQKLTMESMYKRIAACLEEVGSDQSPKDYLNFYALATGESHHGSQASAEPTSPVEETLTSTRRHLVYVHSKMLIADDAVTIIGSANINQRSMDGARDSEIAVASFQPAYLPTDESIPKGDVHAFRLHCWATTTNTMERIFENPSSLQCVRRLNEIAERNWDKFVEPEVTEMDSHLIPYPIMIDACGNVFPRQDFDGFFPDTTACITGTNSLALPPLLTT